MAHALTIRQDGTAEMAYADSHAAHVWHGLGQELTAGASIEEWIVAAGMDWRINSGFVRYNTVRGGENDPGQFRTMQDMRVLFRSDNGNALGVVSDKFHVVQPRQVLEFFRDLVAGTDFELKTAGTLFGGSRFWAMAELKNGAASVADPADRIKANLLLCTACDGSMATEGRFINTAVVCNNTLQAARGEGKARAKISHRTKFNEREMKAALGVAPEHFNAAMESFRMLANTRMTNEQMAVATMELFRGEEVRTMTGKELDKLARSKPVARIAELAMNGVQMGANLAGRTGTRWAWLNAVTEYVDHESRARNDGNRFNSAFFGKGAELKTRAYTMVMADGTEVAMQESETVETLRGTTAAGMDFADLMNRPAAI